MRRQQKKKSPNIKLNTYIKVTIFAVFAIPVFIGLFSLISHMTKLQIENSEVATVNGEPVTVKELLPFVLKHRAEVNDYFIKTPSDKLKKVALEDCVRMKVQQILGKENSLIQDISYKAFLSDLKKENESRKTAVKNKQVIYGPQQYGEREYLSIKFSDMVFQLKEKLNSQFVVTDAEIIKYYDDAIASDKYKKYGSMKIKKIGVLFERRDKDSEKSARQLAEEIRSKLVAGESFNKVYEDYSKLAVQGIDINEQVLDASTRSDDYSPGRYGFTEKVSGLEPGHFSEIIEVGTTFYVAGCLEREDDGFYLPDEVKESITAAIKDKKYENYIDGLVDKAEIIIHQKVYQKLTADGL